MPPESPLATYNAHLERGELAYQFSPSLGSAVFYPRTIAPKTGKGGINSRYGNSTRDAK